jgi:hypothetical protein
MKKTIWAFSVILAYALVTHGQRAETQATGDASNQTSATVSKSNKSINLESGTRLTAELQNTIDVRKARVGDKVVVRTTKAIKSEGRTVVSKGARVFGRVTEVAQKSKDNSASRIGILFDRLEQGRLEVPISATISSITSARTNARGNSDLYDANAGASSQSTTSASSSSGSGSLLGGVGGVVNSTTSTAGNIVGGTTSAVGSTVNSTSNAVANTATSAGRTLGQVQISQSSSTSLEGGSVLSLQGSNLRLEKGTNFNLVLTQSASAGTGRQQ